MGKLRMMVLAGTALALLITLPASAADTAVSDPRDVRGKLDLKEVRRSGNERLTWRMITYERWRVTDIWSAGSLAVDLDTRGDEHPDYYVLLEPTHTDMKARLFRDRRQKDDYEIGKLKAWRKDQKSASFQIPFRRLTVGNEHTTYSWRAQTLFNGNSHCHDVCFDLVPQSEAWVVEPFPGSSPVPDL